MYINSCRLHSASVQREYCTMAEPLWEMEARVCVCVKCSEGALEPSGTNTHARMHIHARANTHTRSTPIPHPDLHSLRCLIRPNYTVSVAQMWLQNKNQLGQCKWNASFSRCMEWAHMMWKSSQARLTPKTLNMTGIHTSVQALWRVARVNVITYRKRNQRNRLGIKGTGQRSLHFLNRFRFQTFCYVPMLTC